MLNRILSAFVVFLPLMCIGSEARSATLGSEFLVNTFTTGDQRGPTVAKLANGGFVVTWYSDGQDGSGFGVYGQRYNVAGGPAGLEFRVNTTKPNDQQNPSVAGLTNGGFVVAWESLNQDGSKYGVYGQRYKASGARDGVEFQINTHTANHQKGPSVAGLTNGGYVVTWTSTGQDSGGSGIYAQLYTAEGATAGGEFKVNTTTAANQDSPSVATLGSGQFIVTWTSAGQDGSQAGIYGQRFSTKGRPIGGEFPVNTTTLDNQLDSSIAALDGGGFVVTWTAEGGQDGSEHGVYGQRFTATARRAGNEFWVNSFTENSQEFPSVSGLSDGGFVVTWNSFGQDPSGNGVYGQRYNALGKRVDFEFRVSSYRPKDQEFSSVSGLDDGKFVVVWRSLGQDGSGYGIYGQRFQP